MDVISPVCCGLDVHKDLVVACLLKGQPGHEVEVELRRFGTTTGQLLAMKEWLQEAGCHEVGMESTGSYWKPVYNLLEDDFSLVVVNSRHLKLVPGRKSDVKDAQWIAELLRHGLLRSSFIPSRDERELRELNRYRTTLTRERADEINRLQKILEGANIKLGSVVSDVAGRSGRDILAAMVAGIEAPSALAELARGRLQKKRASLEEALRGLVRPHQRFLIGLILRRVDGLDAHIAEVSAEIESRLAPFQDARERLQAIPGVGQRTAETILIEVGADMARFPTAKHLASWAGVCPGLKESAGKNRSGRTPKGSSWLRAALVQAAHSTARTKTFLGAKYQRLKARVGAKKAAVAVAHAILVIAYNILRGSPYHELGPAFVPQFDRERAARRLARRLERLGYKVAVEPAA